MTLALLTNGAFGLLPALAFLAMLLQADTFRLVSFPTVLKLITCGGVAAIAANLIGKALIHDAGLDYDTLVRFAAPLFEEALKALFVIYLIRANRIGFVLDAVIAGFAIGAGFALLENYFYLQVLGAGQPAIWVIRGFGTAIMHGGATAIFAILTHLLATRENIASVFRYLPGFAAASLLHFLFNQFLSYPVLSTIAMLAVLTVAFGIAQRRSRQSIERWLDVDFEEYRRRLAEIESGDFGEGRLGEILESLRIRFASSELEEIIAYVKLHTELVLFGEQLLRAEREGERLLIGDDVRKKLAHFHYLDERIGAAVRLVLRRKLRFSRQDLFQLYKIARDAGAVARKNHDFNTDLLLDEPDQIAAQREYPAVYFALDFDALRDVFAPFDERANALKRKSRRWGLMAIALGAVALASAAGAVLLEGHAGGEVRIAAAIGGGALLLSAILGGFGLSYRQRKRHWLSDRLATERLRQFHFQYYALKSADILAAARNTDSATHFREIRTRKLRQFVEDYLANIDEKVHRIAHDDDPGEGMLFDEPPQSIDGTDPNAQQYFDAYARLRFDRQLNYCNHVLRESKGWRRASVTRQAQLLSAIALAGLSGLVVFFGLTFATLAIGGTSNNVIYVFGVWSAIIALSAYTANQGFQPQRDIERMRQYRASLRRAHNRFITAETADRKIDAMLELETLTYQEVVHFLKSTHESQFVL